MPDPESTIYAYQVGDKAGIEIVPAPRRREWMDETPGRFAYRCLPLLIANQSGWFLLNPTGFSARWSGGQEQADIELEFDEKPDSRIASHFGSGIVTVSLPYLFRTPAGINLWVKGPSNVVKDGAQALEGIVESDWSSATFTMNWKLTRPGCPVRFDRGEPICMVVPMPRGLAESLDAVRCPLESNLELATDHEVWSRSRDRFLSLRKRAPGHFGGGWERDYFAGLRPDGHPTEQHQTKLRLREFSWEDKQPSAGA